MIAGDEGKSMTILERISDAPCEPEPFIDYLLAHWRGYLEAPWGGHDRDEEPCAIGSVTINIDHFIGQLEDIKLKMHRPQPAEKAGKANENGVRPPCGDDLDNAIEGDAERTPNATTEPGA